MRMQSNKLLGVSSADVNFNICRLLRGLYLFLV